ncbi:Hypothetical predicted protein [Cloeon dipterum]|uniref:Uncharacterized protein n=1 Tax=Cloeon dipterum TaxID=197152 RepID=A0A8S1CH27_9INSE|nr:Hypothetical predicted protein [Cloeon dipterum]
MADASNSRSQILPELPVSFVTYLPRAHSCAIRDCIGSSYTEGLITACFADLLNGPQSHYGAASGSRSTAKGPIAAGVEDAGRRAVETTRRGACS